jgi:hypothetical protein
MSRQQALADGLRRTMHDELVKELRLRQRNIVFPDTVRNYGVFLRNLSSKSVHAYATHKIFAVFFGFYLLLEHVVAPLVVSAITGLGWFVGFVAIAMSSLWIAVGIKIIVNAVVSEERAGLQLLKTYPRVKI